jgi:hypothetical protein
MQQECLCRVFFLCRGDSKFLGVFGNWTTDSRLNHSYDNHRSIVGSRGALSKLIDGLHDTAAQFSSAGFRVIFENPAHPLSRGTRGHGRRWPP